MKRGVYARRFKRYIENKKQSININIVICSFTYCTHYSVEPHSN